MRGLQIQVPRVLFLLHESNPEKFVRGIVDAMNGARLGTLDYDTLFRYTFNNKSYMKKMYLEVHLSPRIVRNLHVIVRKLGERDEDVDISQIVSFVTDLSLNLKNPSHLGCGYRFRQFGEEKLKQLHQQIFSKSVEASEAVESQNKVKTEVEKVVVKSISEVEKGKDTSSSIEKKPTKAVKKTLSVNGK